jgi:hypothetical protein
MRAGEPLERWRRAAERRWQDAARLLRVLPCLLHTLRRARLGWWSGQKPTTFTVARTKGLGENYLVGVIGGRTVQFRPDDSGFTNQSE